MGCRCRWQQLGRDDVPPPPDATTEAERGLIARCELVPLFPGAKMRFRVLLDGRDLGAVMLRMWSHEYMLPADAPNTAWPGAWRWVTSNRGPNDAPLRAAIRRLLAAAGRLPA